MPVPRKLFADSIEYVKGMQSMKTAKQRAAQLLNAAKRAVEIAIEDNESAALAYLTQIEAQLVDKSGQPA